MVHLGLIGIDAGGGGGAHQLVPNDSGALGEGFKGGIRGLGDLDSGSEEPGAEGFNGIGGKEILAPSRIEWRGSGF